MSLEGLDRLSEKGAALLTADGAAQTHAAFNNWFYNVATWISQNHPNTGLSAEWAAQGTSPLAKGGIFYDDTNTWSLFRRVVQDRLRWLGDLPLKVRLKELSTPVKTQAESQKIGRKEIKINTVSRTYVDPDRINELINLPENDLDLSKLIRLCEEINICFAGECYFAVAMITRSIIDHIPPIFGFKTFTELANNYGDGGRSFKESMLALDNASRKISDLHLHTQIRRSETLPNATQVNFSNQLDLLLSEIARVIKDK